MAVLPIQFRRGTAAEATANNPVLRAGEPGYEEDTGRWKIGDGVTAWNALPYQPSLTADNTFAGDQQIEGRFGVGSQPTTERHPFVTAMFLDAAAAGTDDFVGTALQTRLTGDFTGVAANNPGYAWGITAYTDTGNAAGDGDGITNLTGLLAEATIRSGAEASIGWVTGFSAEAAFMGADAGAVVSQMHSARILAPKRKGGATGGTVTAAYTLYVDKVAPGDAGSADAYTLWVGGGKSVIKGTTYHVVEGTSTPFMVQNEARNQTLAFIDQAGVVYGLQMRTLNAHARVLEDQSGGVLRLKRATGTSRPGAVDTAHIYLRAGSTAGTLKLCIAASSAGAETTILDNIPQ